MGDVFTTSTIITCDNYLNVAALSDRVGVPTAGGVLAEIDDYYADLHGSGQGVAAQVARQLGDPRPKDVSVTRQLDQYRNLAPRWTDWNEVRTTCRNVAAAMLAPEE